MVFDGNVLTEIHHEWVRVFLDGQAVRSGLVSTFEGTGSNDPIIVVGAHWRSNIGNAEDAEARRSRAAEALRGAVARRLEALGPETPVLIMGDFNAEPFARQFDSSLPSSRARDVVLTHEPKDSNDLLFYNPSWRLLGEQHPWTGKGTPTLAGSCRADDKVWKAWRTVDQVLVSGSLLGGSAWALREDTLRVWSHECVFDEANARPRPPFDHLPIVSYLQRA